MDLCSIFAILPLVCNDPEPTPEPEEAPANELVIEAQPAPSVAATSIEPGEGPALPSLSSYLNDGLDAPAVDEPAAVEVETAVVAPAPVYAPQSTARFTEEDFDQVPQQPNVAAARVPDDVDGEITTVRTASGAQVVAIRPEDPDAAAVFVFPAVIANVPADAPELEGPFENPTNLEEYVQQRRHVRSNPIEHMEFDN